MKNQTVRSIFAIPMFLAATVVGHAADGPSSQENADLSGNYCRNNGERFALGESSCIVIGEQAMMAKCDMSINNPSWVNLGENCGTQIDRNSQ